MPFNDSLTILNRFAIAPDIAFPLDNSLFEGLYKLLNRLEPMRKQWIRILTG